MNDSIIIRVDLAKNVFQLHGAKASGNLESRDQRPDTGLY